MQGPYTPGHLKFKAIQDFSWLFEKKNSRLFQQHKNYVLLSVVNIVNINFFTQLRKQWR